MEKTKIIKIGSLVIGIIIILIVILILTKKGENLPIVSKPINETLNLELVINKVKEVEGMQVETEEVKNEEEIEFSEYEILEKKAVVYTNDEEVNEVWMIKLGDYDQQENICRILGTRVQKLKNAFKDNEKQMSIIEKAIIKQENGVVIMIISPYAEDIEKIIATEM